MKLHPVYFLWANNLWNAVIFILCALPPKDIPNPGFQFPHLDKIVHAGMFFISSLLMIHSLKLYRRYKHRKACLTAIGFALVYGGLIEVMQSSFFERSGDWADLAADVTGSIAGCLLYPFIIQHISKRKLKNNSF